MCQLPGKMTAVRIVKAVWPAFAVLAAILVISVFFRELTFITGARAAWMVIFRFIRLTVFLLLPILSLPVVFTLSRAIFRGNPRELVRIQQERGKEISPLKNWLIRPLQGIGVTMLVATKLIVLLEIYTGEGITASVFLPPPSFSAERFLATAAVAVAISLLLSYLWTLEDLGIRLYNRKTGEVLKIGKYFGLILPLVLGFYGLVSLTKSHAMTTAFQYFLQMAFVLYSPFLIFNVFHAFYIGRNENRLLALLNIKSKLAL